MLKLIKYLGIITIPVGCVLHNVPLSLAATVIVILSTAFNNTLIQLNTIKAVIENLDSDPLPPGIPESKLTFTQKVLYTAAYQKGAKSIINKLKKLI